VTDADMEQAEQARGPAHLLAGCCTMPDQKQKSFHMPAPHPSQTETIPAHRAEALTEGGQVAHIQLNGMTYTLRITHAGKLILTK